MPALELAERALEIPTHENLPTTVNVMYVYGFSRPIEVHRTTLAEGVRTDYFIQMYPKSADLSHLIQITSAEKFKILRERLGIL